MNPRQHKKSTPPSRKTRRQKRSQAKSPKTRAHTQDTYTGTDTRNSQAKNSHGTFSHLLPKGSEQTYLSLHTLPTSVFRCKYILYEHNEVAQLRPRPTQTKPDHDTGYTGIPPLFAVNDTKSFQPPIRLCVRRPDTFSVKIHPFVLSYSENN